MSAQICRARCRLGALAGIFFLFCACGFPSLAPVPAIAQSSAQRATPAQIKSDLSRILTQPEFQERAQMHPESGYTRFFKSLREKWDRFTEWLGKLLSIPRVLGGSAGIQWFFIAVFLLVACWILYKLMRRYLALRREGQESGHTVFDFDETETTIVREPDAWLQQAETFANAENYKDALRAVYVAALMQLDRTQILAFDRSRTNGEYVRLLQFKGMIGLQAILRPLTRAFELRWYGTRQTNKRDYQEAVRAFRLLQQQADLAARSTTAETNENGAAQALTPSREGA